MVPKESGFKQSETASGKCARVVWRFPCSSATARDGEVIQRQHFSHHGGTICHPKSSYVTTKLYGTSRPLHVDATIMRSFHTDQFSRFPTPSYAGHVKLAAAKHWQWVPKYRDGSAVEFIIFRVYKFVSA